MTIEEYYNLLIKENEEVTNKIEEYTDIKKNIIVDPYVLIDLRFRKVINDRKIGFLNDTFLDKVKNEEDVYSIINEIKDEKIKNSLLHECELKDEFCLNLAYSKYKKALENDKKPNPFKGMTERESVNAFKEMIKTDELAKNTFKEEIFPMYKAVISNYVRNNINDFLLVFGSKINEETEKEFSNKLENDPPKETIDESRELTNVDSVNELRKIAKSDEDKWVIDYLQNNILTTLNKDGIGFYMSQAENYGVKCEQNLREYAIKNINDNPSFNGIIKRENRSRTECTLTIEKSGHNLIDVKEDFSKMKPTFTDKTKDLMVKIFKKLDSMERYTLPGKEKTPLFSLNLYQPEEGDPKVYGFVGLVDCNKKAKILLKQKNLDEIKKLCIFHQQMVKDYDELIELAKEFDSKSVCGNIGSSRVPELPTKYIKDYENVSKINEMWHCLAVIKQAGCSYEDFINDPVGIYKKNIDVIHDYKFLDQIKEGKNPLEFMHAITTQNKEVMELENKLLLKTNVIRSVNSIGHFDLENMEKNSAIGELNNKLISSDASTAVFCAFTSYFNKDNAVQTMKNLIICKDDSISVAKLTANPNYLKDIYTGETINDFNYEKYMEEHEIDYEKLIDEMYEMKTKANTHKKYAGCKDVIDKATKEIAKDLGKKYDLSKSVSFTKFIDLGGASCESIVKGMRGVKANQFATNTLNEFKANENKEKNIENLLIAYKGLDESYKKRNFFTKIFSYNAYKERKALKDIKTELQNHNFNDIDFEGLLSGETKITDLVESYNELSKMIDDKVEVKNKQVEHIKLSDLENEKGNIIINKNNAEKDLEIQIENSIDDIVIENQKNN